MEVLRIESVTFEVVDSYPLPDLFDRLEVENDFVIITSFNGEKILIPRV
ncbi:MAG: hypothetical protein GX963_08670 [Bacteroidales bacterium]|nr:hypothetical protein [Bacteroidales bacterium]